LKIALIDDDAVRAAVLEDGLRAGGHDDIVRLTTSPGLMARLADLAPDVVIVDLGNPSRDALEEMFVISRQLPRPIAMFVDTSDSAMIEAAVDAGVSAYIVDGLKKERIKAILDMAISRYRAFSRLKEDLSRARAELEERKVVERAKAILMTRRQLSEPEAYALLRRTAMNQGKRIQEIAQALIVAEGLFG
jgi:two-component system, response regulator / RNA-binding antiterminator